MSIEILVLIWLTLGYFGIFDLECGRRRRSSQAHSASSELGAPDTMAIAHDHRHLLEDR
jgi:hypothetical protein